MEYGRVDITDDLAEHLGFKCDGVYELLEADRMTETASVLNEENEVVNLNSLINTGCSFCIEKT